MRSIRYTMLLIGSLLLLLSGCSTPEQTKPVATNPSNSPAPAATEPTPSSDGDKPVQTPADADTKLNQQQEEQPSAKNEEIYQNDIFRKVTVKKTADHTYLVQGEAQIFEAVVDYVVEDGHDELVKGSVQASSGAPDWGAFTFPVEVKKERPDSTLTLILFETSAKDGSRLKELTIPLPE